MLATKFDILIDLKCLVVYCYERNEDKKLHLLAKNDFGLTNSRTVKTMQCDLSGYITIKQLC